MNVKLVKADGTIENPFTTIREALDASSSDKPGKVIFVMPPKSVWDAIVIEPLNEVTITKEADILALLGSIS